MKKGKKMKKKKKMKKYYIFRMEGIWAVQMLKHLPGILENYFWFVQELFGIFEWAFDYNVTIISHNLEDMKIKMAEMVKGYTIISIDPCIPGDYNIGISRIFKPGGVAEIGIGTRPDFCSFEELIESLPPGKYILIEDDIWSGGTIQKSLDRISAINPQVIIEKVACGISVGEKKVKAEVVSIYAFDGGKVIDLNDPRDFLAGAFGGGLVIKLPNGSKVRAPYLLPFVDSNARSSIPKDKVLEFSKKVWELNIAFWQKYPEVKLSEVEKYFFELMKSYGYTGQESMVKVCQDILALLPEGDA